MFSFNPRVRSTSSMLGSMVAAASIGCLCLAIGCNSSHKANEQIKLTSRYQSLPPREVPAFLKDSILERCDMGNTAPMVVSGFGLVVNLRGTGDTFAGTPVRNYILTTMVKRGFGSKLLPGYENLEPEDVLRDPRCAIVRVDALLPPGARKDQRFDLYVTALEGNNTTSLAHGDLYRTDLKVNGANLQAPGYTIDIWAQGEGAIFVNPAYALSANPTSPEARASLRQGVIPAGAVAMMDRPLILRLRQPQLSMSRAIEFRIDQAFQNPATAAAKDEALIALYLPKRYGTDWEHFTQVVKHLYLRSSPDFTVVKARELAEEAVKPDAPLLDISYCWEALGPGALPFVTPLMTSDNPDVAYAAARAAVFLGDASAQSVLMQMARTNGHPFQISAVQTLAKMTPTPEINQMLRSLLDSDQSLVRIEAYRALSENGDSSVISKRIVRPTGDDSFILDIVPSKGPPLIYASRSGIPRIAVIGNRPQLNTPVIFTAMDKQLSISSEPGRDVLTIFYRGTDVEKPISIASGPDLAELVSRLGGVSAPGQPPLNFDYCEVVALLQKMADQQLISAPQPGLGASRLPAAFVLQDAPQIEQSIEQAPMIQDQQPTQAPEKVGSADSAMNSAPEHLR